MGRNLGVFRQMGTYMSTDFRTGRSDGITGPDLPMDRYSRRRSYDGENAGWRCVPSGVAVRWIAG